MILQVCRCRERAYGLLRMLCHGHTDGMHYAYRRVLHGAALPGIRTVKDHEMNGPLELLMK